MSNRFLISFKMAAWRPSWMSGHTVFSDLDISKSIQDNHRFTIDDG